jgi:hypothetical protein
MARRCRCPPDNALPPSATNVSYHIGMRSTSVAKRSQLRCLADLGQRHVGRVEGNVLTESTGKDVGVLKHDAELLANLAEVQIVQGNSVIENLAARGEIQTHQQFCQCALP